MELHRRVWVYMYMYIVPIRAYIALRASDWKPSQPGLREIQVGMCVYIDKYIYVLQPVCFMLHESPLSHL